MQFNLTFNKIMGYTYADITLYNTEDEVLVRHRFKKADEVRHVAVRALVDSGAITLVISEHLKLQLGLSVLRTTETEMANGTIQETEIVGPITVRFKNRAITCDAFVLPGLSEVLLGVIPIEGMDVIIDPLKEELALPPDRPYLPLAKIK
ncbi:MAG: retroviral-like aspartic protease family protein [Planctomycetaceae bacterium]|jgi:clan AA aspartic protease|nr:retroviral-like aspartic protease family protein [Planctomycetaceae bacterium]